MLGVANESWAHDILNNSGDGSRNFVIPFSASTPMSSRNDSLNNTFSTANLTPMRVSTLRQIEMDTSMSPAPAPANQAWRAAAAAVVPPAAAAGVAPAAAAGVTTIGVAPATANGRTQRRRQRRNNAAPAVAPSPSVSAYEAMLAEKSCINRIVGAEMIRLVKLNKMASFEASREKALYYKLKRELAAKKTNEGGK